MAYGMRLHVTEKENHYQTTYLSEAARLLSFDTPKTGDFKGVDKFEIETQGREALEQAGHIVAPDAPVWYEYNGDNCLAFTCYSLD